MASELGDGYAFQSSAFEVEPGEDLETNPRRYGRQVANWLRKEFIGLGYDVEDVIAEDWGWCVMCQRQPFSLWIGCGNVEDVIDVSPDDPPPAPERLIWQVFPAVDVPVSKKLFGSRPETATGLDRLDRELESVLNGHPEIRLLDENEVEELLETFQPIDGAQIEPGIGKNQHLFSLGIRWVLASFAFLFAFIMYLHGTGHPTPFFSYFFGFFCAAVGIISITTGRVRQFFGSFVGLTVFAAGLAYLYSEISGGTFFSGSRSEPSVVNAIAFMIIFGIPGLIYALHARFGTRSRSKDL